MCTMYHRHGKHRVIVELSETTVLEGLHYQTQEWEIIFVYM